MTLRIGNGFDIHRLTPGLPFVLGGVKVDFPSGSEGHSDGDVVVHSIIDALLGCIAGGDIGQHFPPGDPSIKGIDSMIMLARVMEMVREKAFSVVNVDVTIVCEKPKLSGLYVSMRERLSGALGVDFSCVSIKAKTAEKLGPIGESQAVAAYAVALLAKD